MTAAEFYKWVGDCARDLTVLEGRRDALRTPRSGGQHASSPGSKSDPTARLAIAAADEGPGIDEAIDRCRRVVRMGRDVTGQVGVACGTIPALAMTLHYLDGNGWQEIAIELKMSLSTVYRIRRAVLEWVDDSGLVSQLGKLDSR